jgi:hypothetical protein
MRTQLRRVAVPGAPALTLRLREPVFALLRETRRATALALQVDDPAALRAALSH